MHTDYFPVTFLTNGFFNACLIVWYVTNEPIKHEPVTVSAFFNVSVSGRYCSNCSKKFKYNQANKTGKYWASNTIYSRVQKLIKFQKKVVKKFNCFDVILIILLIDYEGISISIGRVGKWLAMNYNSLNPTLLGKNHLSNLIIRSNN